MANKKRKAKIMMVEDDIFLVKLYRRKLTRLGFEFIASSSGIEGVRRIIKEKPDLILLDLVLPGKSGFEVLEEIKKNPVTADIPVIILSNLEQEADIKEGLALGAEGYLVKSDLFLSEVIDKIKKCLPKG